VLSTFTPSFCYRLDKDTSGVIIAAITYPALQLLNELIRERKVSKVYHAIVVGDTPEKGSIDKPLFK
jgi:23S rRNA pseudouridine955/2504/2580 synthase